MKKNMVLSFFASVAFLLAIFFVFPDLFADNIEYANKPQSAKLPTLDEIKNKIYPPKNEVVPLDTVAYDKKMLDLANNPPDPIVYETVKTQVKDKNGKMVTKITRVPMSPQPTRTHFWPVKTVYPNPGALLPFNRIVAYYGNLYSTKMGVLGEYKEDIMLAKLQDEVKKWSDADPDTKVIPALHYIAVVAQGGAGADGKYRARMPSTEMDKVLKMAEKIGAIVFLDIQVGFSTLQSEVPLLSKYLKLPNVHLGIDPEFSMKSGIRPGKVVGTFDATDINYAANYLASVVKENNLPPKILIVHRYTQKMVTNYKNITPLPEVQIVMHMDGWGGKAKKIGTYKNFIYPEPVQFTGFKLFYKNDISTGDKAIMTPEEVLKLNPKPIYIQYQ